MGPRGLQGAAAVPLLVLITSDSPLMQPHWGRRRDAIADRPPLLTATTCLPRRTDKISHGSVGKHPGLLRHKEPPHTPRDAYQGVAEGLQVEMQLCCSATCIQVRPIAWRTTSPSCTMVYGTRCRLCVQQQFTTGRKIRSSLVVRHHKRIGISGKPTSSRCFS